MQFDPSHLARSLMLFAVVACFLTGCGSWKRFAYEGIGRDWWQQPERVVAALELEPGTRIADLGAGGGYFTFRFSDAVGDGGSVLALDVDPDLTDYVRERAAREGRGNVTSVLVGPDDPGLQASSVDVIFLSNVYHHLEDRTEYFAGLRGALAEGGRVVIVEGKPTGWISWWFGHHTEPELIRTEMRAAGYDLRVAHDFLSHQSFQEFVVR